jgi:hypothetical protein
MTALAPATTRPATFRGAPIEDPTPAVEAAARAWMDATMVLERAHGAYRLTARLKRFDDMSLSEKDTLGRQWDHWQAAEKDCREALLALGRAVVGPKRCWPVRGFLIGYGKDPERNGYGGHTLFVLPPGHPLNPLTKGVTT